MLYSNQKILKEEFKNPSSEYRGTPFWAWNCKMTRENIDYSLDALQAMGMGGGHIHCRTGMQNEYLGEEFMELVQYTNEELSKRNMLTWLYDEDRWPSGAGGGYVTKDKSYRMRFLVFTPENQDEKSYGKRFDTKTACASATPIRSNERQLLNRYGVILKNGYLQSYRVLDDTSALAEDEVLWYAYLEVCGQNPWFNNQAYLNTLDKRAVERFIEVTHEKYYERLGGEFGKCIPAIFTDEPQFAHKRRLRYAEDLNDIILPFTDDLEESFAAKYGESLLAQLPELFWELPEGQVSRIRYEYHDHIAERFANAFADTVGDWCDNHGILLSGHMMEEPTLESQTAALGEAMRSYRSFGLPGVDMLCDQRELSTVKQAQSAVHQYGREGVMSELYGVTNWDFDFRGHKLQGDWQAALGVTVRVPHLTWTSMEGEAKRDYPASIGYQSPWYKEYNYVEDYFARLNVVLSRGVPKVKIGVIHPIESYWLYWGNDEQTGGIRREMDNNFDSLIRWLLYGLLDFDFIAESLLPDLCTGEMEDGALKVGAMKYEAILVPNCRTLRRSTLEILDRFAAAGGKLIFAGEVPKLIDVKESSEAEALANQSICVAFNEQHILNALQENRQLDVRDESGNRTTNIIYQLREEEGRSWLFLAHVDKMKKIDVPKKESLRISIKGLWNIVKYQPLDGTWEASKATQKDGETFLAVEMYEHDSLLLELIPEVISEIALPETNAPKVLGEEIVLPNRVPVTLEEPNVLLLDMGEYKFDDGPWGDVDEVLRIDNKFREHLGYSLRMEAFPQPWVNQEKMIAQHTLSMRFDIFSEVEVQTVDLGIEDSENVTITWNERRIEARKNGWYVDRAIHKLELGALQKGWNQLIVSMPFHEKTNVECMYLLGDFGVVVEGRKAKIIEPVNELAFADITRQGLPFYGGNVIYHLEVETLDGEISVEVSKFRCPLIKAVLDKEKEGVIAYSPYLVELGKVEAGKHRIDLIIYGNRVNTFGTLHNADEDLEWYGVNAWRTEGSSWSYEYQLRRMGILKAPVCRVRN